MRKWLEKNKYCISIVFKYDNYKYKATSLADHSLLQTKCEIITELYVK